MEKYCYKDKTRVCDEGCVSFHGGEKSGNSLSFGNDLGGDFLTGNCLELSAKMRQAEALNRIAILLEFNSTMEHGLDKG